MKNEVEKRREKGKKEKGRRGPWTDEIATKRNYTVGRERGVKMKRYCILIQVTQD